MCDMWSAVYDVWCMMYDVWCMMYDDVTDAFMLNCRYNIKVINTPSTYVRLNIDKEDFGTLFAVGQVAYLCMQVQYNVPCWWMMYDVWCMMMYDMMCDVWRMMMYDVWCVMISITYQNLIPVYSITLNLGLIPCMFVIMKYYSITYITLHITHHTSHITHHTSHTHHISYTIHHASRITSHITHRTSHITHHASYIHTYIQLVTGFFGPIKSKSWHDSKFFIISTAFGVCVCVCACMCMRAYVCILTVYVCVCM